jgi:hypothetical protein
MGFVTHQVAKTKKDQNNSCISYHQSSDITNSSINQSSQSFKSQVLTRHIILLPSVLEPTTESFQ